MTPIDADFTLPAIGPVSTWSVEVCFGDCDPAGIVFFPNYLRWMDSASLHWFRCCGLPPWRELERSHGLIGTPLLEIRTRFRRSASYGQTLSVQSQVVAWQRRTVTQHHRVFDEHGELLCEGLELRAFCQRGADGRISAMAFPDDLRQRCGAPSLTAS